MTWREALEAINGRDGTLSPPAVVTEARKATSPLHPFFEWDDGRAAEEHRINQARRLIRRYEVVVIDSHPTPVRAFVSLGSDRKPGRGYRQMARVLSDPEQRAELLEQAIRELHAVRSRYGQLQELALVFAALDKVATPRKSRTKRAKRTG